MDNGEVIPGLNEQWTLGGAKLFEWIAGFAAFMIVAEVVFGGASGRVMPQLLVTWIVTTFGLAGLRRRFPDEERGMRNFCMTSLGIAPPGIPTPASIQPYWSGCRVRSLPPKCQMVEQELDKILDEAAEAGSEKVVQ
jgi:hypothetical protein